jgi:hypothetical protein
LRERKRESEREREVSTKTTINNCASIAIAEGDAACGWLAERLTEEINNIQQLSILMIQ